MNVFSMLNRMIDRLDERRAKRQYPVSDWRELDRFVNKPFYFYHQIIGYRGMGISVLWREPSNAETQLLVASCDHRNSTVDVLEKRPATETELSFYRKFIGKNDFSQVQSQVKRCHAKGLVHCFAIKNEDCDPCFFCFSSNVNKDLLAGDALVGSMRVFPNSGLFRRI